MRRHLAAACALAVTLVAGVVAPVSNAETAPQTAPTAETTEGTVVLDVGDRLLKQIRKLRRETWRWERLMRVRRTTASRAAELSAELEHRRRILAAWRRKAAVRRAQAYRPPRVRQWLCIYRHERNPRQGWATRTGNGFYGGLQMNIGFQRTYAPELLRKKGTANRWSAIEQIWVAERAYRSGQGFHPWPNTARYCGLL
jgi:hypothetical protein